MIELVIKIPKGAYNLLKTSGVDWLGAEHILNAVANGTPLPEDYKDRKNDILGKIEAEFINRYPKNYADEPEMGGRSCVFSLNEILRIIDKYKMEKQ